MCWAFIKTGNVERKLKEKCGQEGRARWLVEKRAGTKKEDDVEGGRAKHSLQKLRRERKRWILMPFVFRGLIRPWQWGSEFKYDVQMMLHGWAITVSIPAIVHCSRPVGCRCCWCKTDCLRPMTRRLGKFGTEHIKLLISQPGSLFFHKSVLQNAHVDPSNHHAV